MAQLGLDLPHEGRCDSLFVLVGGRVQVQDLHDLRDLQLVAHLTNLVDVVVGLASLKFHKKRYHFNSGMEYMVRSFKEILL